MRKIHTGFLAAALALAVAQPAVADLRLPPPGYTFTPAPGCDRPSRQVKLYDDCADQMALFLRARAEAYGAQKQLLVVFGANWCPSCRSLKSTISSPRVMDRVFKGTALKDRVHVLEVAVSLLHQGRVTAVPSGQAVLAAVLMAKPGVRHRAIPFMATIDPVSGKVSARNLDDLDGPNGWLGDGVATVVAAAAPREPGWLRRKWLRWFGY
jgi:thiol-disulfide isomerase/thioredoxin